MAVNVDHFGKAGRAETHGKPGTVKPVSKQTGKPNVFQALLNKLKSKENNPAPVSFKNKPLSSKIVRPDHKFALKGNGAAHGTHNTTHNSHGTHGNYLQNVNNMAASALIAMATLSSGPNRISSLCAQNPCRYGRSLGLSNAAAGYAGRADAGAGIFHGQKIGSLSAHFESGESGPGAVGYDYKGGTSYGTYQIASRTGTMRNFIGYLSENAPDMAAKLKSAGPSNTGSCSGRMPIVWKKIAAEDPVRFSRLQYDFIEKSHYLPALQEISEQTGMDISRAPRVMKEVLWSTAVQHGPKGAAKIFTKAIQRSRSGDGGVKTARLIDSVYDLRANQIGSSEYQAALKNRFREEGRVALSMLSDPYQSPDGIKA